MSSRPSVISTIIHSTYNQKHGRIKIYHFQYYKRLHAAYSVPDSHKIIPDNNRLK